MTDARQQTIKILLLGDSGVGKSCLLLRFTDDTFSDEHQSTIGVDYRFKMLNDVSRSVGTCKLMLWDTAGQERFRTLTSSYYRGAHGVILVYDVARRESFTNIESVWIKDLESYVQLDKVCLMLIGNKVDLEHREVAVEDGRELAKKLGALFMECSAKTKKGVSEAFDELVGRIVMSPEILESHSPNMANLRGFDRENRSGGQSSCSC